MKHVVKSNTFFEASGPILLLHGGAWDIPDSELSDYRQGMQDALAVGRNQLEAGVAAETIVAAVVASMEDSGAFDAGRGSVLRSDRTPVLDAGIMRGRDLGFGSVGAVRRVKNPILLASTLLDRGHGNVRFVVGRDAEDLAEKLGCDLVESSYHVCQREIDRFEQLSSELEYHTSKNFVDSAVPRGTVGCVVRDRHGMIAAGTSTGGTPLSPPGRVGDTPLPGCGFYASSAAGASATGWGEAIATVMLCGRVVDDLGAGRCTLEQSARSHLSHMYSAVKAPVGGGGTGGIIAVTADGHFAWAFSTPRMARAFWTPEAGEYITV